MAFNVNELNVIRSYIAVTGSAPTQDQLAAAFNFSSLNALTRELTLGNTQSNEDFVKALYTNLLGREADAAGLEYWVSLMSSSQGLNALSKAAVTTAFQWAAADNAANEPTLVDGTAGLSPVGGAFPVGGGDEEEPGTGEPGVEYQDTFTFDTEIGRSDVAGWSHIKGDANEAAVGVAAPVGAERADYESKTHKIFNIGKEAIDKGINTISADYTFKVSNQLGDQGKYEGYFLSPILDNTTTNLGAVLTLEVIDRMAEANNKADALSLVAIESFSFYLNGEQKVIGSQAILNATTYEELRDAIAAELTAQGLTNVSVTLGSDFTRQQVDVNTLDTTGANVLGTQIILTASGNSVIERGGFAFGERAGVDRNVDPSGRQDTSALGSTTSLISTNIELQNVGYGSQGGSINISGQSESKTGVEEFNVKANAHGNTGLGVWLTELSSNPLKDAKQNALKVVNVTGGAKYFHVGTEQAAALRNNEGAVKAGSDNAGLTDVRFFNGSQFAGNTKINANITDKVIARDLNLKDTQGNPASDNVTYTYNTGAGNDQIILSVSQKLLAHEDASLVINAGAGSDYIHLVHTDTDTANQLANHQALNNVIITASSGNNTIWTEGEGNVSIVTGGGNDTIYTDNSGSQDDTYLKTLVTPGAVTQAELDGLKAVGVTLTKTDATGVSSTVAAGDNLVAFTVTSNAPVHAHWLINAGNTVMNDIDGNGAGAGIFLYGGKLTVTYAPTTLGLATETAAAYGEGFESLVVDIPTGTNFTVTQRHINQAIKKAINEDPVLSKLLVATDGPNDSLVVKSLIDGAMTAASIGIAIEGPTSATLQGLTGAEGNTVLTAYKAFMSDSSLAMGAITQGDWNALPGVLANEATTALVYAGSASTASTENKINAGAGNDVIVLGTNTSEAEVVVFNAGSIGNNTIVNFEQGSDTLDFTAWLNNVDSASGSTVSQVRIATDVVAIGAMTANGVSVTNFDTLVTAGTLADTITFANLTNANILTALNAANATFNGADLTGSANFVGTVQKAILLIENLDTAGTNLSQNEGQYKVVEVTFAEAGGNSGFTAANIIGTIDFGQSVTFVQADFV